MNSDTSTESAFLSPVEPNWTIAGLLEWISSDDTRCHDERLASALDAADRALGAEASPSTARVVLRVRALAERVAAEPAVGERRLRPVIAVDQEPVGAADLALV